MYCGSECGMPLFVWFYSGSVLVLFWLCSGSQSQSPVHSGFILVSYCCIVVLFWFHWLYSTLTLFILGCILILFWLYCGSVQNGFLAGGLYFGFILETHPTKTNNENEGG